MGVLAQAQNKPIGEFDFAGINYYFDRLDSLNSYPVQYSIPCYKLVKEKQEQYLFITNEKFKVIRFYSYKEGRWYDVESENKSITIKYYF